LAKLAKLRQAVYSFGKVEKAKTGGIQQLWQSCQNFAKAKTGGTRELWQSSILTMKKIIADRFLPDDVQREQDRCQKKQ